MMALTKEQPPPPPVACPHDEEPEDERQFQIALDHLARIGRLQTPRADQWQRSEPRPTWLVEAVPYMGE